MSTNEKQPAGINSLGSLKKFSDDSVSRGNGWSVDPRVLIEEEGFNPRGSFAKDYWSRPEVMAHVRQFAEAYKSGAFVPPITVIVRNADVIVRDGHHRRRGALLAIEEGHPLQRVQVNELAGDEVAQTTLTLTAAAGIPLAPLDKAVQYSKFIAWGFTVAEIAKKAGTSAEHVRTTLPLISLPLALKEMIAEDQVSASLALSLYNEHGAQAVDLIAQALANLADEEEHLRQAVGTLALSLDEATSDPVAPVETSSKPEGASTETSPAGAEAPASPEASAAAQRKPRVTGKHINKLLPTAPKIAKKTVQFVHRSFESLSSSIDKIKRDGEGGFVMTLTIEEVELLKQMKNELAAAGASVEAQGKLEGQDEQKDNSQGDMVDELEEQQEASTTA